MNREKIIQEIPGVIFGMVVGSCTLTMIYAFRNQLWFAALSSWIITVSMGLSARGKRERGDRT